MTISSVTNKVSYSGNGSTTVFAYSFPITADADLAVYVRSAAGTETLQTLTTHYTVSGAGSASGGNVTFVTAPISGTTAVILRDIATTQSLDLVENDSFSAESLEDSLDRLTMIASDVEEELARSIKLSRTNTMTSTEFTTSSADRASKILSFDSSGELSVTQELGTFTGNWAASTGYVIRDITKDTSNGNIYICVTAHTSTGSQPISSNTDSAKWSLIVDAASSTTSQTAAATSATTATTQASNASTSASGASTSASTATTKASEASTSATNAATSATASATSATAAAASATAALPLSGGVMSGALDMNAQELILDLDGDTSITADTDDQIDIKIAGADDFQFTANTFTAQSGSTIAAQALTATTITASGNVDFNGDLDVDGTTNLDVVDIDGAVNLASTIALTDTAYFLGAPTNGYRFNSSDDSINAMVLTNAGSATFTGGIAIDGQNAATPGLAEKGDPNTGIFWPAADAVGVSTGGTERMRIDSSGNVGIGVFPPLEKLHVQGSSPSMKVTASNAGGGAELKLQSDQGNDDQDTWAIKAHPDHALDFINLVSGAWNTRLRIDSSGDAQFSGDVTSIGGQAISAAQWEYVGTATDAFTTGAVDVAHHSATGTPSSSTYLRGDNTWSTVSGGGGGISNIVEDTTPQLGGDLSLNGNVITGLVIGTDIQAELTNAVDDLTTGEVTQLANIGTSAISATEWGYVAAATAAFTSTLETKLDAIEASATADQTNAEIVAAVEAGSDSNTFTDADHSKLNAIAGTNTGDEVAASLTVSGTVEIATVAETNTGTDATRAVSPAGLTGWTGDTGIVTVGTVATGTWQGTAIAETYIADDSITLAKLAGLARGKIIYGDSSGNPAVLAVGSANEVLTHDGTDVSWAAAGGGGSGGAWTFLSSVSATTASTVDIETTFNDTYHAYVIVASNVLGSSAGNVECLFKIGGSYLTAGYYGHASFPDWLSAGHAGFTMASVSEIRVMGQAGTAIRPSGFVMTMPLDPTSTSSRKFVTWTGWSGQAFQNAVGAANCNTAGALTGIRFQASSGTIGGVYRLYGIAKS